MMLLPSEEDSLLFLSEDFTKTNINIPLFEVRFQQAVKCVGNSKKQTTLYVNSIYEKWAHQLILEQSSSKKIKESPQPYDLIQNHQFVKIKKYTYNTGTSKSSLNTKSQMIITNKDGTSQKKQYSCRFQTSLVLQSENQQ